MKLLFTPAALYQGLTRYGYGKLPKREQQNFTLCRKCHHYFDRRRLDQAIAHSLLDHDARHPTPQEFKRFRAKPVNIRSSNVARLGAGGVPNLRSR